MARTATLRRGWLDECIESIALWLRYSRHFASSRQVYLKPGSKRYYEDAEVSEWASRLGEAFGYLEMQRRGYIFIDHFEKAVSWSLIYPEKTIMRTIIWILWCMFSRMEQYL